MGLNFGYNLIGDSSGCSFAPAAGDLVNVDPFLGPLAANGGPTETHALLPGSDAIDMGNPDLIVTPISLIHQCGS